MPICYILTAKTKTSLQSDKRDYDLCISSGLYMYSAASYKKLRSQTANNKGKDLTVRVHLLFA